MCMTKLGVAQECIISKLINEIQRKKLYSHFSIYRKKHSIKSNIYSGFFFKQKSQMRNEKELPDNKHHQKLERRREGRKERRKEGRKEGRKRKKDYHKYHSL